MELKLGSTERYVRPTYPEHSFRPGTPCEPITINFMFLNGGMGDYVCWSQAIRWQAAKNTWITGRVVVADYMVEPMNYWLKQLNPNWQAWNYKQLKEREDEGMPFRGPLEMSKESMNATGAHLLDCGFVYFANQCPNPEGWDNYPPFLQVDLDKLLHKFEERLPQKYAIITTGKTSPSRAVPDKYWNDIIEHVAARGITPVFLGATTIVTGNKANIETKFGAGVRYDLGIDLRNQTSTMEAAAVMSRAEFVVGHDNGLLHLAGCTEVPIIFGYNVASPKHRRPRRPVGEVYDVFLTHEELACIHCQSNTNFLIGYNFNRCFYEPQDRKQAELDGKPYENSKCIDLLFAGGAARFKRAIDKCLVDNARRDNT